MKIRLMDESERKLIAVYELDENREVRRPRMQYGGKFYQASRQDTNGTWIYRHVPNTK